MSFRVLSGWRQLNRSKLRVRTRKGSTKVEEGPEPPNGFLFNEKPLLPGEKRVKEPWENVYIYGMALNLFILVVGAFFKPDTSVNAWAREQALARLEQAEANAIALCKIPDIDDQNSQDNSRPTS